MVADRDKWERQFEELERTDEDQLFASLGEWRRKKQDSKYRVGDTVGRPAKEKSLIVEGSEWFGRWVQRNRLKICRDPRIRDAMEKDFTRRELFLILVDILAGFGIPVATVSYLIAKGGLRTICGWSKD